MNEVMTCKGYRKHATGIGYPSQKLREIAIHEAGHAVLAWVTGRRIVRLSMVSDEQDLNVHPVYGVEAGSLMVGPLPPGIDLRKERILAEREAMIALAGELAAIRFRGSDTKKELSRSDLEGLTYIAAHSGESEERLSSCLDRLAALTALYLEVYWRHVEVLAEALMNSRELTGQEVTDVLRGVEKRGS